MTRAEQATGLNKGASILRGATGLKHQRCKQLLKALTEAEREELLDRVDALADDALAAPGETLCVVCLIPLRGNHCLNGCSSLYHWGDKATELAAYYRNRRAARAVETR